MTKLKMCDCGHQPTNVEVTWLTKVMSTPKVILKLYNCPKCQTTKTVKVERKAA